jgi:ATP-binding cassette subfamily B protein
MEIKNDTSNLDNQETNDIVHGKYFFNNKPFRTLFHLYKGNYWRLFLSFIFFIVKHCPAWIIPIITSNVINIATAPQNHSTNELLINASIAVALIIQNIPTSILYTKYFSLASRHVEADLRSNLVRKLQMLSISYHKHLQSGKLQSKVLRDVEAITTLSRQFCNGIVPMITNMVIALTITMCKSFTVALFFMASMPVSFFIVRIFRKNIRSSNKNFRKDIENMSGKIAEMVEMIPITRAHGLETVEINKIDEHLNKIKKSGYRVDILNAFFGASGWAIFQSFQIICLMFTGYLAYQGKISVGDVVLYQSYFSSILNQVSSIINVYPDIIKGFESVNSVGEIFLAEDIEDNTGKKKIKTVNGKFEFQNLNFKYPDSDEYILNNFNLNVKAGECMAFVGESGAGKTTILNLVIGFIKPTSGQIYIDGIDIENIDLHDFRKYLAVVPQNTILFSGTIRDNITYGVPNVSDKKLKEVIDAANLNDVIERLPNGIDTSIGEHGGILSGGQRQRISIARALIRDPKIIILDEATSALDNKSELHVQQAMKNLAKGRTTFIVAHRLSTIRDADRIVVVRDGQCVECGSYDELMDKKGEFYNLKKLQV